MMKDKLDTIFKDRRAEFDFNEPEPGHFKRFKDRLETKKKPGIRYVSWAWMAVAASVLIIFGIWFGRNMAPGRGLELADVSPKMEETQNFFMQTIQKEIAQIEKNKTPDNQKIINDAFEQLRILENNYKKLTLELKESNEDKRVIFAMISNFQQRIKVLQNLMQQLEDIDKIKNRKEQIV